MIDFISRKLFGIRRVRAPARPQEGISAEVLKASVPTLAPLDDVERVARALAAMNGSERGAK